jgi:citrate lyase alpha subunit
MHLFSYFIVMIFSIYCLQAKPKTRHNVVALIEWHDGTVIDCVKELDIE